MTPYDSLDHEGLECVRESAKRHLANIEAEIARRAALPKKPKTVPVLEIQESEGWGHVGLPGHKYDERLAFVHRKNCRREGIDPDEFANIIAHVYPMRDFIRAWASGTLNDDAFHGGNWLAGRIGAEQRMYDPICEEAAARALGWLV